MKNKIYAVYLINKIKRRIFLIRGTIFNYKLKDISFYFINSQSLTSINSKLSYFICFTNQMFIEYGMENSDYLFNIFVNGKLIKLIKFKYLIQ